MILTIAYPSRGTTDPSFACALRLLSIPKDFDKFQVIYVSGADTAVARNKLALTAKGDYIFWVDDDVLPPPDAIEKLYSHKKDFVAGLYFARQQPHFPQIHRVSKKKGRYDTIIDYPQNELIRVDACGAGCMLIKRSVFEKISEPYFQYIPGTTKTDQKGEDYYFCEKLREAKIELYCDTSVVCKHVGTKFIGPEFWEISKAKIDEIKKTMGEKGFEKYKESVIKYQEQHRMEI